MLKRVATISRKTTETDISLKINLDGKGISHIRSELPFFNHMLTLFSKHGFFDLELNLKGDLQVGAHHCLEDAGICLGRAIKEALGQKRGIRRYGYCLLPMDEALVRIALDLSGRGRFFFNLSDIKLKDIGMIEGESWSEFFTATSYEGGFTLHIDLLKGENTHHIIEAVFKAFGRALEQAKSQENRLEGDTPSTKGILT